MDARSPIRLRRGDLRAASVVCARGFVRAPHIAHFFREERRRCSHAEELFRLRIRYGLLFGEVYTTSPNLEGVAVWLPAERASMTVWREIRAGGIRLYRAVGADAVARMTHVSTHNERLRCRSISGGHWVLSMVAVDPAHQRRGHASALIKLVLARLEREHVLCYAETTDPGVLPFYARMGFRPGVPATVPGTDLKVWPLVHSIPGG